MSIIITDSVNNINHSIVKLAVTKGKKTKEFNSMVLGDTLKDSKSLNNITER